MDVNGWNDWQRAIHGGKVKHRYTKKGQRTTKARRTAEKRSFLKKCGRC